MINPANRRPDAPMPPIAADGIAPSTTGPPCLVRFYGQRLFEMKKPWFYGHFK